MTSHLADYFRAMRRARGLTPEELARLAGYQNTARAAVRIIRFEWHGAATEELLARVADALGVDLPTVEALMARDGLAGGGAEVAGAPQAHPSAG